MDNQLLLLLVISLLIIIVVFLSVLYIYNYNNIKNKIYTALENKTDPKVSRTKYYLKIEFKRGDNYTPQVIENYWYRNRLFRWWKRHIDTVGKNATVKENGVVEKYGLEPYFTQWEE